MNRPLASGAISKTTAKIIFVLLILSVVLLVFLVEIIFIKILPNFLSSLPLISS
jgi:4-hydroxybenzoate polyprenyltransferase